MQIAAPLEVRTSPVLLEPGVVGLFRPMLLLPAGIVERLAPRQLEALLAHEYCHVRRRDNLLSVIHMVVEAIFWFHPLVWWIGARLVEERERACDEAVLTLGSEPREYADAILSICRSYLESPLSCVSGVTGANLNRRIHTILSGRSPRELNFTKKSALAAAGIAALTLPLIAGIMSATRVEAQTSIAQTTAATPHFKRSPSDLVRLFVAAARKTGLLERSVPSVRLSNAWSSRLTVCSPTVTCIRYRLSRWPEGRTGSGPTCTRSRRKQKVQKAAS